LSINGCWKKIDRRNPISEKQWGFSQGISTVGALLTAVDNWRQSLEAKMDVCVVFFDLKKAFDSVPHRLLATTQTFYAWY